MCRSVGRRTWGGAVFECVLSVSRAFKRRRRDESTAVEIHTVRVLSARCLLRSSCRLSTARYATTVVVPSYGLRAHALRPVLPCLEKPRARAPGAAVAPRVTSPVAVGDRGRACLARDRARLGLGLGLGLGLRLVRVRG